MPAPLLSQPARAIGASLLRGQTDARLVALSRAGHEDAYAAIVRRHRPALVRYCTGIVGPDRAQDAVQQTFIAAHEAMLKDDRDIELRPWLYRIAHNAAVGLMRGAPKLSVVPDDLTSASAASSPEEAAELRDRLRRTIAAIEQLPAAQRDAVLLQAFEGASHGEVASALGLSAGAARQQLYRARSTLRTAVTSLTPMPLLTKLMVATGGGAGAVGWTEMIAGSGFSAVTLKVGAGLAATAAIAGGGIESGVIDPPSLKADTSTVRVVQQSPGPSPSRPAAIVDQNEEKSGSGDGENARKDGDGSDKSDRKERKGELGEAKAGEHGEHGADKLGRDLSHKPPVPNEGKRRKGHGGKGKDPRKERQGGRVDEPGDLIEIGKGESGSGSRSDGSGSSKDPVAREAD